MHFLLAMLLGKLFLADAIDSAYKIEPVAGGKRANRRALPSRPDCTSGRSSDD